MSELGHRGNIIRAVGVSTAVLLGAIGCSGGSNAERPSVETEHDTPTTAHQATGACEPIKFTIPKYEDVSYPNEPKFTDSALSQTDAETYDQAFRESTNFENSSRILNEVFNRWGINVHVGEIPKEAIDKKDPKVLVHNPKGITQHTLDTSARHMVDAFAKIPKPLVETLKDTLNIYLSSGLHIGKTELDQYWVVDNNAKKTDLVLSIDKNVQTGETFLWDFANLLTDRMCGASADFKNFATNNPKGFQYGKELVGMEHFAVFAFEETPKTPREDFAQIVYALLQDGLPTECNPSYPKAALSRQYRKDTPPLCKKYQAVLQTIASLDRKSAQQLVANGSS